MKDPLITCGIYLYSKTRNKILVCHATNSRWTQWSIPKGLSREGESTLEVATRELEEETAINLSDLDIQKAAELPSVKYQKQNKILKSFLIIIENNLEGHVFKSNLVENKNFPEIDSWKWIDIAQASTMLHEAQAKNLDTIRVLIKTE